VNGVAILQAMMIAGVLFIFAALVGTIQYRITPDAVEVLTLGRVARRIPLADIIEVHRRGALLHENWSGPGSGMPSPSDAAGGCSATS